MGKSLQDCRILTIFAPVNVIYSLKLNYETEIKEKK